MREGREHRLHDYENFVIGEGENITPPQPSPLTKGRGREGRGCETNS